MQPSRCWSARAPIPSPCRGCAGGGVSVGALYQYLPDREAIVEALSATYYGRLEDLMDRLVADLSATRPEDPVGAVIEAMADLYRDASGTRALRSMLMGASQTAQARAHKQRMVAKTHTLLARPTGSSTPMLRTQLPVRSSSPRTGSCIASRCVRLLRACAVLLALLGAMRFHDHDQAFIRNTPAC